MWMEFLHLLKEMFPAFSEFDILPHIQNLPGQPIEVLIEHFLNLPAHATEDKKEMEIEQAKQPPKKVEDDKGAVNMISDDPIEFHYQGNKPEDASLSNSGRKESAKKSIQAQLQEIRKEKNLQWKYNTGDSSSTANPHTGGRYDQALQIRNIKEKQHKKMAKFKAQPEKSLDPIRYKRSQRSRNYLKICSATL